MKLVPYEILSLLGTGAMGEVYRALDTSLGREVAVKVLHPGTLHDPDRLRRFRQEAQSAASLNHPNILAIHFVGEHNGSVSELLDGENLRERLRRDRLPVRKCLDIAAHLIGLYIAVTYAGGAERVFGGCVQSSDTGTSVVIRLDVA